MCNKIKILMFQEFIGENINCRHKSNGAKEKCQQEMLKGQFDFICFGVLMFFDFLERSQHVEVVLNDPCIREVMNGSVKVGSPRVKHSKHGRMQGGCKPARCLYNCHFGTCILCFV